MSRSAPNPYLRATFDGFSNWFDQLVYLNLLPFLVHFFALDDPSIMAIRFTSKVAYTSISQSFHLTHPNFHKDRNWFVNRCFFFGYHNHLLVWGHAYLRDSNNYPCCRIEESILSYICLSDKLWRKHHTSVAKYQYVISQVNAVQEYSLEDEDPWAEDF